MQAVCHAAAFKAIGTALEGYISQNHLVLLDFALNKPLVEQWVEQRAVSCPTLVMILAVAEILASQS